MSTDDVRNPGTALVRIGELSRRTGVSVELLRAWEARYGLLRPRRTPGGFRLYGERDESRVRRMRGLVGSGLSASEAAHAVLRGEDATGASTSVPPGIAEELDLSLVALDEPGAHATLDRLFSAVPLELSIARVIVPELRSIGDRWAAGVLTVAQEHFASALIRSRLLSLARGWDQGRGRRAVLACAPGELHDIGLVCFGLLLHRHGWRVVYLGQDTPVDAAATALRRPRADALVVASVERRRFARAASALAEVGKRTTLLIGGAGATAAGARRMNAVLLPQDLADAATQLAAGTQATRRT
ncbi:MAG TPA: MerR family transcriptional regulator [Candidatus Limnocylindria bacterium]|nr:MerR family transcriptional regulator [Candidatus Limnocylindria bacterium]